MKRQSLKKTNEGDAKTRLMEAGIALFAEQGYASASVREIVARAGVTKPVLYYYFESKEGLFQSILNHADALQGEMLAHVLEHSGTTLERLSELYRMTYEGVARHKSLFKMIYNMIFGSPQGAPPFDFERYQRRMVDAIRAIYLEGTMRGEVVEAEPEEVAILVLGILNFCFHLERVNPKLSDPNRPERLLHLAFQGLTLQRESGQ
ncbi:MAG: TetR/AcrR family transcriptional regulator [Desulfobacteraceae bacterium]